jgi:hypothetical protein
MQAGIWLLGPNTLPQVKKDCAPVLRLNVVWLFGLKIRPCYSFHSSVFTFVIGMVVLCLLCLYILEANNLFHFIG